MLIIALMLQHVSPLIVRGVELETNELEDTQVEEVDVMEEEVLIEDVVVVELEDAQVEEIDSVEEEVLTDEVIAILPFSVDVFGGTVSDGETVTITSDVTGNIAVNGGTLILDDAFTITGTVTVTNGGTFNMSAGRITGAGRGVTLNTNSTFNMSGGNIEGNEIGGYGIAGVYVEATATFNLSGSASINNNLSHTRGGGVAVAGRFNMSGGSITENTSNSSSGGVVVFQGGQFVMSDGLIARNVSNNLDGGGIFLTQLMDYFYMSGGTITENSAPNGHGGGIFVLASSLERVTISNDATIVNNQASVEQVSNYLNNLHNIEAGGRINPAPWSGTDNDHAFNGHDIGLFPVSVSFNLHDGNGEFPNQNVAFGNSATEPVEAPTRLGYQFVGWFTGATEGTAFDFTAPITVNTVIHARWERVAVTPSTYEVSFNLHGGSGEFPNQSVTSGGLATKPTATPVRSGYQFVGWFTNATEGTAFDFTIPITADTVIHSRWERIETPPAPVTNAQQDNGTPTLPQTGSSVSSTLLAGLGVVTIGMAVGFKRGKKVTE